MARFLNSGALSELAIFFLGSTRRYSAASDVWSYGVMVWEVMTSARIPYDEIATLMEVIAHVKGGNVLPQPVNCPSEIYTALMLPCWNPVYSERPCFSALSAVAGAICGSGTSALASSNEQSVQDIRTSQVSPVPLSISLGNCGSLACSSH